MEILERILAILDRALENKKKKTSYCGRDSSERFLVVWGIGVHGHDAKT